MDSTIERQAIRAAVALAAASSHAHSPEVVADLRDESAQLIGLCMHATSAVRDVLSWCDDATALMQRLTSAGALTDEYALHASAAVLRLRLAVTRLAAADIRNVSKKSGAPASEKRQPEVQEKREPVKLIGNLQIVAKHIKEHPDMRVKDIISALSGAFSPRSVKRYLSELVALRAVSRKQSDDGGVIYSMKD